MNESVTIDGAVKLLNEMLAADVGATAALIANRVPCNKALADHPTIQVHRQHDVTFVGLLGVINGLFGVDSDDEWPIGYVFDNEADPSNDGKRLVRFMRMA